MFAEVLALLCFTLLQVKINKIAILIIEARLSKC